MSSAMEGLAAGAWTCPDCGRTYRSPLDWEVPVWLSSRRAAQYLHAQRHGRVALIERRRRRDDPPPEEDPPGEPG
jgi:hypothetical protein